jgi:hypothetical protein
MEVNIELKQICVVMLVRIFINGAFISFSFLCFFISLYRASIFDWTRSCFLLTAREVKRAHVPASLYPNKMLALYLSKYIYFYKYSFPCY